ncbi:MAG TPA: glycosyl hydrolase family 8 [Acidimicrobiales bacterium]|jgi:endo-1,4-beta-D-glucanase Y|nr:glycosyl hydrolase family 8 [Acidimicrobiales bacterium]
MGAVVVVAGAVALGIGTSGESTGSSARGRDAPPTPLNAQPAAGPRWAADQAFGATAYFLAHYELPNGRVVRWDQGADTVSEGEAYAMLLSVAAGDRRRFDAAWYWTRAHLRQPDGLLAWHWANGAITSSEPAADADVDTAYALELASTRLHEPGDLAAAEAMASAIAGNETASSPTGRVLAAGPWAVGPPAYVDPSYASPSELGSLARLPGEAQSYAALAAGTRALVEQDMGPDTLPPDWVQVTGSAPVDVAPQGNRADDRYGFDAVRVPIRWGASCNSSDRQAVAALWPVLGPAALRGHATVDLGLRRGEDQGRGAVRSPVGLVAAAASGWAAGHRDRALALLSRAEALDRARPTYYSSAWVALGRVFFETSRLGTCPAWST